MAMGMTEDQLTMSESRQGVHRGGREKRSSVVLETFGPWGNSWTF